MKGGMFKNLLVASGLLVIVLFCVNMGEGGNKYSSGSGEPSYAPLEEGAGNFSGTVHDESTKTELTGISFFGSTSVGGIRKETDDSVNTLRMEDVREIAVTDPNFQSKRFTDKALVKARVTMKNSIVVNDILIPKHVVLCGVEASGMQKAWFIEKVNRIVIHGPVSEDGQEKGKKIEAGPSTSSQATMDDGDQGKKKR